MQGASAQIAGEPGPKPIDRRVRQARVAQLVDRPVRLARALARRRNSRRLNCRWPTSAALFLLCLTFVAPAGAQTPTMACPPLTSTVSKSAPASTGPVDPAPEQIVACIGSQPITGVTFSHWEAIARRSQEPSSKHRPATGSEMLKEVMGFLISSDWVLGEASDLNVHVSAAEVRHTFDRLRAQQFPRQRELKAFLKQSGETVADLLLRVRLNLLSQRIQRHVLIGHRGQHSRQRALTRFVHDFKLKWMAQTYCDPGYAVQDCGHVQASL